MRQLKAIWYLQILWESAQNSRIRKLMQPLENAELSPQPLIIVPRYVMLIWWMLTKLNFNRSYYCLKQSINLQDFITSEPIPFQLYKLYMYMFFFLTRKHEVQKPRRDNWFTPYDFQRLSFDFQFPMWFPTSDLPLSTSDNYQGKRINECLFSDPIKILFSIKSSTLKSIIRSLSSQSLNE